MSSEPRRTPLEIAAIAVFSAAYFLLGFAFFVGLPAVAIMRASQHGATIIGVLWGAFAVLLVGMIVQAIIRDRETRGWVAFLAFGWLGVFPMIAHALFEGWLLASCSPSTSGGREKGSSSDLAACKG